MMRSALDDLYSHEKIAAYHTLSDSAKYTYWYFRITDYLEGDFRPGNQDQTDALLELRDSLSYRLYSDTAVRDAFKTNFLNDWIADNTVLLDVHLIRAGDLLSDPEAESDIAGKYAPDFPDLGGNNCVCNIGSGYACKKLVVNTTFPYSTYWVYGACSVGTVCTTVTYGCGFWALWSCNGNLCTYS